MAIRAIFIGGCGRSGTTLLASMLGGDARTVSLPESQFIRELLPVVRVPSRGDMAALRSTFTAHHRFGAWREHGCDGAIDIDGVDSYAELVGALAEHYATSAGKARVERFVEHSPQNLLAFDRLEHHFPDAAFIHIVRDGRAVANSVIGLDWGPHDIVDAAHYWTRMVSIGLAAGYRNRPARLMTVFFEDLVRTPAETVRQVAQFIGMPYAESLLRGDGFRPPNYTRAQHRLVGKSPDPGRADAWKTALSGRQIELFEFYAGDLLRMLGYEPMFPGKRKGPRRLETAAMTIQAQFRRAVKRRLYKRRHGL